MKKNQSERLAAKAAAKSENKVEAPATVEPKAKKPKTVKPEPSKEENELDNQSATAVVKKITNEKDLKYNYPADCDTLPARKKFRAEVRRNIASFEKDIAKLMGSDKKEDVKLLKAKTKAADSYLKEHLAKG